MSNLREKRFLPQNLDESAVIESSEAYRQNHLGLASGMQFVAPSFPQHPAPYYPQIQLVPNITYWVPPCCQPPPQMAYQARPTQNLVLMPPTYVIPPNVPTQTIEPVGPVDVDPPSENSRPSEKNRASDPVLLHPFDYSYCTMTDARGNPLTPAVVHARPDKPPAPKRWKCCHCGSVEPDQKSLVRHMIEHKRKNDEERERRVKIAESEKVLGDNKKKSETIDCPICQKTFSRTGIAYKQHVSQRHQPRDFYCERCDRNYRSVYTFSVHSRKHDSVYTCSACGEKFAGTRSLFTHVSKLHAPTYNCDECGESFHTSEWYEGHKVFHETDTVSTVKTADDLYCEECRLPFPFKLNLERHVQRTHIKNQFVCDVCGKTFDSVNLLTTHKVKHSPSGRQQCHVCGKTLCKKFMRNHLRVSHGGQRPYKCVTCGKSFTQKGTLNIHARAHTGERPFVCESCGKGHVSRTSLNAHKKSCKVKK